MDTTNTTPTTNKRSKLALAILMACTIAMVGGRETYGSTSTATAWPQTSALPRAEGKSTVLMFVYPSDARSEAKIAELAATLATVKNRPFVAVVHVADTQPTALWDTSGKLLQSARLLDKGGVEAKRFGAVSTGHTVVYDAAGQLQYTGSVSQLRPALGN
jgi:hypothetical protein